MNEIYNVGSRWSETMDPDSVASEAENPAESDRRKRRERRGSTKLQEREDAQIVTRVTRSESTIFITYRLQYRSPIT